MKDFFSVMQYSSKVVSRLATYASAMKCEIPTGITDSADVLIKKLRVEV